MQIHRLKSFLSHAVAAAMVAGLLTACGGGEEGTPPTPPTVTSASFFFDVLQPVPSGATLSATGTGPFKWSSAPLPAGLSLSEDGTISGTPTTAGPNTVKVTATGPGGTDEEDILIQVLATTHRVSEDSTGAGGNGGSGDGSVAGIQRSIDPGISGDGRFVVFDSDATNLVAGATTNGNRHIFLKDRQTGEVELISKSTAGDEGNADSHVAVVSDDGRFVAFDSYASNLVANDGNNSRDVFIRDRQLGKTERISQQPSGTDGLCPQGQGENCNSFDPTMSADGSIVAFGSLAQLLPADQNNAGAGFAWADVYVSNRTTGVLQLVSQNANGGSGSPSVSADGRFIAYSSTATTLAPNDTVDNSSDIYRFDLTAGQTIKVSTAFINGVPADGGSFQPSISQDGQVVAFASEARNLTETNEPDPILDVYFATLGGGTPVITKATVSPTFGVSNGECQLPSISRDGRFIAFQAVATNLVAGGTSGQQIFVLERGVSIKLASTPSGNPLVGGNASSFSPAISGDGRFIAFFSDASNLSSGDSGGVRDTFVVQRP